MDIMNPLSIREKVTSQSRPASDLEPCIFPTFKKDEDDLPQILNLNGTLHNIATGDPVHAQRVSCAAWAILLTCFTGLEKVCFAFDDESDNKEEGLRVKQVHVRSEDSVQSVLDWAFSALLKVSQDKAAASFNTRLSFCSLDAQASAKSACDEKNNNSHGSWCTIQLSVDPASLKTELSWTASAMTREQAEHVNSTYEKIISEICRHPGALVSELDYFSEQNSRQVLQWNSTPKSNIRKCIHAAISDSGALSPGAEAVCAWDGSFSYEQLLSLADRLAYRLRESGVGPEIFVPICFEKSRWNIVAILAVLKAGGVFVPLDPGHPVPRLQALTRKLDAKTLLCSRSHVRMLETVATELIAVDDQLFAQLPEDGEPVAHGSWDNGAYMIFTSGTTGEPKGALIQHGALLSSAMAHGPAMMMSSDTRSLQFAASTFDVSITEILTCLILGGCVCIPSEDARLNAIESAITQLQANWALLTPTFVKFINPADVPCLKTLVTGGEAMTEAIIRSWSHINLINCYGPAETSVVSHVHRGMNIGKNPLNIGHQVGVHCWIVDRDDHNRLMPVGAVGELVIEGYTLAREYYMEPDKTASSFITDPTWTRTQPDQCRGRRMYKTGDLARYNHDGTFHIAGRKDSQIKFHGQRIELGEIEHHIGVSPIIKHAMVVLPKAGLCSGRLVAIIQLGDALNQDLVRNGQPYRLVDGELGDTARTRVEEVKQLLGERLPPYMIPSTWLAVEFIPRLLSGKLDRKQTLRWIEEMSESLFRRLNPATPRGPSEDLAFASKTELELHKIWSHVLNLQDHQLGLERSFLGVGGDSISAMQVMSECKKRGMGLAVSHIIGSKSIRALALRVKNLETTLFQAEMLEEPFELSPIQSLYFSRKDHVLGHYNQSFLLRTSRRILAADMRRAIEAVIQRHSMLRARFSQNVEGKWQQRVTNEVASSYRLRTLKLAHEDDMGQSLAETQTCLSETDGPLLAADLIDIGGQEELLFVVAHHLIVDLVSWRIILKELEELVLRPELVSLDAERPLPFQTWCRMQLEHAESLPPERALPIQGIPDGDAEYWGMKSAPNVYGQMVREGFEIGPELTSQLLSDCHDALRTQVPDVLLAAIIFSFAQTFTDRGVPAIFAEGHGREAWDTSVDLSNVVGWFTTIYPVFANTTFQTSLVDTAKLVKDSRRKVPDSGRPYFASRWLTQKGQEAFARHWPLEITFNYLGQYQQLERQGALFTAANNIAGEVQGASPGADIGPMTPCISLFEVSAVVVKGALRFSFIFSRDMKHQEKIHQWVALCEQSLGALVHELSSRDPEPTLSDFPLLPLSYDGLRTMTKQRLPQAGISMGLIEDAYPCSPVQSGLLLSTSKNDAYYAAYTLHEVKSRSDLAVDTAKLANAWRRVVGYHAILRTIFIESAAQKDASYDQIVAKTVEYSILTTEHDTEEDAIAALSSPPLHQQDKAELLHHFQICTTGTGKVFCRLDISHVIMDGTSMSILFRDLALAYDGGLQPGQAPLYREYIRYLEEQPVEPGIDYWKSYLSGVEPCHFPVLDDGAVIDKQELRSIRITVEKLTQLQSFCDSHGVTIVNAIYAAWALTLSLYTAADEVCFGYLTSARDLPIPGIRDVVGPVINMIPCRVDVSSSNTLGSVMAAVQKDYLESLAYRHTALAEVQHALQLSTTALFNTALSYRKLPPDEVNAPSIMFDECRPTYDPDEYNVSINIEAGKQDMAIDLMYWTHTLSDDQATNVASTFNKALSNILHHHDQPIGQLSHLGDWSRVKLDDWNNQMPDAAPGHIHDLFQEQASRRPTAPAIASWDANFNYADLDEVSSRLAHHLATLGVGPEVLVLVCFHKSAFAIVAMLAVLKAGGASVPLDPAHPDTALRLRAEDSGSTIALVTPSLVSRLEKMVKQTVAVDSDLLGSLALSGSSTLATVTPRNACFVIYTSGSTGRPKGVILEHRGLVTNAEYAGRSIGYGPDSRVLQFASYTFDNSLMEIFTTLLRGGCVCVPSEQERLNDLTGAINRMQVTLADLTPTVACLLSPADVPTLRILALGGEAVTTKCVDIWRDAVSLHCCYGPSECSVNSTHCRNIAQPNKATNIGRAVGSLAWVVHPDNHECLLPVGCAGELLVDGPIVSRGYLNLPEKTEQAFVKSPSWLGDHPDRRLYKTGDLVRYDTDGSLVYLGRKDTQVKLNGRRIELGEIEHHVDQILPESTQSAVEVIVSSGVKVLACFICVDSGGSVAATDSAILPIDDGFRTQAKELEVILSGRLAAYMIPTVWLPTSGMPFTSSGKLDRRRLRLQAQAVSPSTLISYKLATKSGRSPSSDIERLLADMWVAVLGVEATSIGIQDNFFKLGGDSIGAMRLVTRARKQGVELTVAGIFQKPTLLDMVSSVDMARPKQASVDAKAITVDPFSLVTEGSLDGLKTTLAAQARINVKAIQDIYPCTAMQEGLMALSNREPGAYVARFVYHLRRDTDAARFMRAWELVVKNEPTLRTRIVHAQDFGFSQVVVEEAIEWSYLTGLCDVEETQRRLPSYNGGRLTKYAIVTDGPNATSFVWTIHHALYDGWCLPIILNRVRDCYEGLPQQPGPSYACFIKYITELDSTQSEAFWRTRLSGISNNEFPRLPSPDHQANASSLIIHKAPLQRHPGSEITIATRIRAAWGLTVSAYSASTDVVFWETVTGRDTLVSDVEDMVGATLATVPTRMLFDPSLSVSDFLRSVQNQSAAAMPHAHIGIQRIKRLSAETALACGAQNLIAINDGPRHSDDGFWNEQSDEMVDTNFYTYPLMLSCHIGEQEVETVAHFDEQVLSEGQVHRVLDHFAFMLESVGCAEVNTKLSQLDMISPSDCKVLEKWNSIMPSCTDSLIHYMIQERGRAQNPNKHAVCAWDDNFTYAELDTLSTSLSSILLDNGIGSSSIVPFCLERSSAVVVSMLAILKSGAAFVPLDPAHPDDRVRGILADVEATVVVCSTQYSRRFNSIGVKTVTVSRAAIENVSPSDAPASVLSTDSPAYVIFTSGTTGKPKGTIISHSAFCSGASAHGSAMGISESSRVLQFASYTFDASIMEILTTLIRGGTVCIPSDEERLNDISGVIGRMNVNWALLTPSVAQLVQPATVPGLETLVLGGEAVGSAHISTWSSSGTRLMNAYGPSEAAVVAAVNPDVALASDPANIGRAVGVVCWVVGASNHDRLVPIGAVGELVLEGPTLAQGYLRDTHKTAESFITAPRWRRRFANAAESVRQMYKTGDLVKLAEDGTIVFQGRKDNQVKINGQRLELSEVEHHLGASSLVQSGMVVVPLSGPFKKRLVAVLSLKRTSKAEKQPEKRNMRLIETNTVSLADIRGRLAAQLAAYMIPTSWIIVEDIPLLPSGKLDRRHVVNWVEEMSDEQHQSILSAQEAPTLHRQVSHVEASLRLAWAKVLRLKVDAVPLNCSFIHLGGDSISAMQLMAVCQSFNIGVAVGPIMQSKSIPELATYATTTDHTGYELEKVDESFDLSPIQKVYFECIGVGSSHFNQSVLLGTTRNVTASDLSTALYTIIELHSMLRARFSVVDGRWSQRITKDIFGSYQLRSHTNVEEDGLSASIGESQRCLDITKGPLFAADLFDMADRQVISFVTHHLVVDIVSWHIILHDLEQIFSSDGYRPARPLSFQSWNSMQYKQAQTTSPGALESVPSDLSYWGMEDIPNVHGEAVTETFEMDADYSSLLLGPCHSALQTDVVDVLLATILISFRSAFPDRLVPSILNEGHGREPWDEKTDLSRTVGWFTTLFPIGLPDSMPAEADMLDIVSWVKDVRRRAPGNGRAHFSHALLCESGRQFQQWPAEILFNYLGRAQQVDGDDLVFKTLDGSLMDSLSSETDIGANVARLALVEISASVISGRLSMSFSYNRRMDHQDSIRQWMNMCKASIRHTVDKLCRTKPQPTMNDFRLFPLTYKGVSRIQERLSQAGISSMDDVEAAYPCSAVQEGILLSQLKSPEYYAYAITFEVKSAQSGRVMDAQRLASAWQAVTDRHSTLRTVFVDGLSNEGAMDQIVLKTHPAIIDVFEGTDAELAQKLTVHHSPPSPNHPPHHLTICQTPDNRLFCVLKMSHALSDGASMPILFRDLALAYEGTLPISSLSAYEGFITHIQQHGLTSKAMEYWKGYLEGVEPCCLASSTEVAGPKALRTLDQTITHGPELQVFCTARGVTLSNVLQLAWALVLQAYTGLDHVCFGYMVAGRDVPVDRIDEAIGVFVSMLVCRVHLDPATTLRDILQSVQTDLGEGMQHKQVSLARVQHELNTSKGPLFNTAYSFQRRSVSKAMTTGPISFDVRDAQDPSEYSLTVNVEVWDSSAELQLCYWSDKVSDERAKHIASTFDQVLSSIMASDAAAAIGELGMLSRHCEEQLASWNHAEPDIIERCVHHVFEHNAEHQRDTPAVDAWDARLAYGQFNDVASQLAQHLVDLGVKPGKYVHLCFAKSAWTVVAMMAVLKAGGAIVPLDPTHPPERISLLLKNVDAQLILCSSSLTGKFTDLGAHVFAVSEESICHLHTSLKPRAQATPDDPAYIIFTSGTSGVPKGTIIGHGAFTTGAIAHARATKMTSSSRVLQFASHTFDASILEILTTLLVGGCVCIPSEHDRMNNLAAAMARFNVNWALLTPSVASVLKPSAVPGLKVLVTGGELMSQGHIAKWADKTLVNAYGPSEASVIAAASIKIDEAGVVQDRQPATIGHAVSSRSWVVDPRNHNRLMPIGSIGELVIEGPIVAKGYLNNEAKTRDAFIQHPPWRSAMRLAGARTDRMYKTGDLVTYNTDGSLSYVARKDTQIKLNGQRIELGEIEHHVRANLPADVQSVVELVVPHKTSTKALAVFIAENAHLVDNDEILLPMSAQSNAQSQSLKTGLRGALPPYMIPSIYIPVTRLPWTSSGKLDRQRLRAAVQSMSSQQISAYKLTGASHKSAPATPMERKLHLAWQKVLNLAADAICRSDHFFRMGGDSVSAMKLVSVIRIEGASLTVMNIFKHPKLSDMAAACVLTDDSSASVVERFSLLQNVVSLPELLNEIAGRCDIQPSQIQDIYPCSALQEGMMTSTLGQPGAYVASHVFELPQDVDIGLFKRAWQSAVDQVDMLRSRIANAKDLSCYQVVVQSRPIIWNTVSSMEKAADMARSVPGSNGGALARYTIVDTTDSARYFVWTIHHALYDAWSMSPVLNLVSTLYYQDTSSLFQTPFANYIKYLADIDVNASNAFWRARLENASPSRFPPVTVAPRNASNRSLNHTFSLGAGSISMVVSLSTIIRAAWALVVGLHTCSDDIVFGETLSGRDIALDGIGDVLGPTLTTVPTRIKIDRQATVGDLLETIHKRSTELIPYQHAGLQHIRRLDDSMAAICDFNNLLVIQMVEESARQQHLMQQVEDGPEQSFFTYPLVVECAIATQSLDLTMHHDEGILTHWQVERLASQFESFVMQLINGAQEPSLKFSDLDLCDQQDIEMIKTWNNSPFQTVEETIPSLVFEAAGRHPNATAIQSWDGELNYDGVLRHASRFARSLVQKGVRPETSVACCMDKSLWTPVAMLGVLLAGGVLVPMDPAHPSARLVNIAQDCGARLVLCSPCHAKQFEGQVDSVLPVDGDLFASAVDCTGEVLPTLTPHHAAFIIYTSGSTGKPKGVVVEHGCFCTSSTAFMNRMHLTESSRVFHFASYAFDIAMAETFGTLMIGAHLCVPSEEARTGDLPRAMNSLQATWAFLTPSVASVQDASLFTTLETLVCGGEALSPEIIATWADKVVLMNGYGPAECTVFCVANAGVSTAKDHTNIGRAMSAGHTWIVDPRDHNQLVPIGCVGELLIDGPIVARGYLGQESKTAEAFVKSPAWTRRFTEESMRLYKTGDLVKYCPDGSLTFVGRKDHQVKLHGQRMELGEIEAHLESDHHIRHAMVNLPNSGPCDGRLVAVVSLQGLGLEPVVASSELVPLPNHVLKAARSQISTIRKRLLERLPQYMVPSAWIVVESVPLMVSGKLDRAKTDKWVATMDTDIYKIFVGSETFKDLTEPESVTAKILRKFWASILDVAEDAVPINQSFINMGGDSITAMQVMTRCRDHSIRLSLQEMLQGGSITDLAKLIDTDSRRTQSAIPECKEQVNQTFALSPIQQLFFNNSSNQEQGDRFNQSQLLSVTRKFEAFMFERASKCVVQRHSMLRSRFSKDSGKQWTQLIVPYVEGSYSFRSHEITTRSDMVPLIAASQRSTSISGPMFIVDLFEQDGEPQVLSLIAHHLVVDVVSWFSIIQDLETFLTTSSPRLSVPLSFQAWNAAQVGNAQESESRGNLLPFTLKPANLGFWGMLGKDNLYGDAVRKSFVVSDPSIVSLALVGSHAALSTEPLDICISVLLHSFGIIFKERALPPLFNEGHGREPWDHSTDISATVGWFTALCPVQILPENLDDAMDYVRRVKDTRRRIQSNGRQYFAHRYLTASGRRDLDEHEPMEILLNYIGRAQQTSGRQSLLVPVDLPMSEEDEIRVSDVAPETHRLALFEISISVLEEGICFSFMYNKNMLHQERINEWVTSCESVFMDVVQVLAEAPPTPTLSDVPLLPIDYHELHTLLTKSLPAAQVNSFDDVEDIFPCSPMQTGILLSQLQDPGRYLFHTVLEVTHGESAIDAQRLSEACVQVIHRHPALRTVFINSVYRGGTFDQVVLKPHDSHKVSLIQCREIDVMVKMNAQSLREANRQPGPKLPCQFTICQTPQGKIFMKLEMNHAVTDGASTARVMQDISTAYTDNNLSSAPPAYKEYIKYISNQPKEASLDFWTSYLSGAPPTRLPAHSRPVAQCGLGSVAVGFRRFSNLYSLSSTNGVTFSNIMLAAWALMLRSLTASEDVCFGYLASGRDAPIDGIDNIVGPFINMLVFRFQFAPDMLLKSFFDVIQKDYLASLPHQHFSLASVIHKLGGKDRSLFNTAVSVQNAGSSSHSTSDVLNYESMDAHDPTEYAVTLNVNTTRGDEGIVLRYWDDVLSDSQAENLAQSLSDLLSDFIDHSEDAIGGLRLFQRSQTFLYERAYDSDLSQSQDDSFNRQDYASSTKSSHVDSMEFSTPKIVSRGARVRHLLYDKLTTLWKEALGLNDDEVSEEASFFELGGDSIVAMSIVGNAREANIPLLVADVFNNPTFGQMLHCLLERSAEECELSTSDDETSPSSKDGVSVDEETYVTFSLLKHPDPEKFVREQVCAIAGVSRASIVDVLPTTDFQAQAIEGSLLNPCWMLNYFYLDGAGCLDPDLLRESIDIVLASYDILRTVFVLHEKRYLQVILRRVQPELTIYEVDNIDTFTCELEHSRRHESLRLGQPLVRFIVARQKSSQRHRIFLRISHAQYDGVCFPAILEALKRCYEGGVLVPSPSYATYIRGALGKITSDHYAYWSKLLWGSAPTNVVSRQRESLQTYPCEVLQRVIPIRTHDARNFTTATVVKAAWSAVLSRITGKSDVVFGHLISGRNVDGVSGIESIVGPCLNLIPVRVPYQASWTVTQLLEHVQKQQVDNIPYEPLGFRELIETCTDWGDDWGGSGFSTVVQHQSMARTSGLCIGETEYEVGTMASKEDAADFSVVTTPLEADKLEVCLLYARHSGDDAILAERMFEYLCKAIQGFFGRPDSAPLSLF